MKIVILFNFLVKIKWNEIKYHLFPAATNSNHMVINDVK